MLLRDVNFATRMLISLKVVFEGVAATLDGPSDALANVSEQNLESLKGVAALLTEVVTGMQGASKVGKSVGKSEEDDPVPTDEKTDEAPEPTGNEAVLAAIAEMSAKFDAVSERLTILESTDDQEESDDPPNESDEDEDGDGETEPGVLLTEAEIAEGIELFPTMTAEEQAAFQGLLEAQASDFPDDGDDGPPATSDEGDGDDATA